MDKVSTADKFKIMRYLLKNRALVVEDTPLGTHPTLNISNLHVNKFMEKFGAHGYLEKVYVWRHAYFFLNEQGEEKLIGDLVFSTESEGYTQAQEEIEKA